MRVEVDTGKPQINYKWQCHIALLSNMGYRRVSLAMATLQVAHRYQMTTRTMRYCSMCPWKHANGATHSIGRLTGRSVDWIIEIKPPLSNMVVSGWPITRMSTVVGVASSLLRISAWMSPILHHTPS